jgi:hypothetical protein
MVYIDRLQSGAKKKQGGYIILLPYFVGVDKSNNQFLQA